MKPLLFACTSLLGVVSVLLAKDVPGIASDTALQKLKDGNRRYATDKLSHPDQSAQRRAEVAMGQHPFAIILGCSDSRVGPEVIFDQGLGDLFVIRIAGNVVDDNALGSIEYAVEHLGSRLVVVLGHERCGAVDATLKGGEVEGHINSLVKAIRPAVESAKGKQGDALENAVKENAKKVAEALSESEPVLKPLVKEGKVKVVAAYYDLDTGTVSMLD